MASNLAQTQIIIAGSNPGRSLEPEILSSKVLLDPIQIIIIKVHQRVSQMFKFNLAFLSTYAFPKT